jgi:hypothetical protein
LLSEHSSDIKSFNFAVSAIVDQLTALGKTHDYLLDNLFDAYKMAPDTDFVAYMKNLESAWQDNTTDNLTPAQLMALAENKFKNLVAGKKWSGVSPADAKIIALQAQLDVFIAQKGAKVVTNKAAGSGGHRKNVGDWA